MRLNEDGKRDPHTHRCPKCDKRVTCNDPWCDRKKKYCKEHSVLCTAAK